VKREINTRRFETEIDAVKALEAILKRLFKNGLQHVFEQWQHPWDKVVALRREYIECDKSNSFCELNPTLY
jgi:hypothetical protein